MTEQIQPRQCKTCRYSEGSYVPRLDAALWCWKHGRLYPEPCDDFEREPGADDE